MHLLIAEIRLVYSATSRFLVQRRIISSSTIYKLKFYASSKMGFISSNLIFDYKKGEASHLTLNYSIYFWWWWKFASIFCEHCIFSYAPLQGVPKISIFTLKIKVQVYRVPKQVLYRNFAKKCIKITKFEKFVKVCLHWVSLQFDEFFDKKFQNSNFAISRQILLEHPVLSPTLREKSAFTSKICINKIF